jgi:hypothetical protein
LALLVHRSLRGSLTLHASRLCQSFFEQHDGAEHHTQGSEKGTDQGFHKGLKFQMVWMKR